MIADEAHDVRNERLDSLFRDRAVVLRYLACARFRVPAGDAEGLLQDVFTAFLAQQHRVEQPHAWLVGAICNASRQYWRQRKREEPLPPDIENRADPRRGETELLLERLAVTATLGRLGAKCREALRRYYYAEESFAEIAAALGTSPGYVKFLMHQCRKRAGVVYAELTRVKS
jgi:RNA polymerase sigma factor (sigma-70 family)